LLQLLLLCLRLRETDRTALMPPTAAAAVHALLLMLAFCIPLPAAPWYRSQASQPALLLLLLLLAARGLVSITALLS
jgi:hypothetical protein